MPGYSKRVDIPGKNSAELYEKVSGEIDRLLAGLPMGKLDIQKDPQLKQVRLKASMVNATLVCEDGKIRLEGQLSLMAAPFRSKIDDAIDKWVAKTFNV
jgi:hypothetical protein